MAESNPLLPTVGVTNNKGRKDQMVSNFQGTLTANREKDFMRIKRKILLKGRVKSTQRKSLKLAPELDLICNRRTILIFKLRTTFHYPALGRFNIEVVLNFHI